jgi:hypothetical protein
MSNVFQIKPCAVPQIALRNIADGMDSGEFCAENVTIIAGTEVFHCGCVDDARAAMEAVWNMTYGIHKLMNAGLKE